MRKIFLSLLLACLGLATLLLATSCTSNLREPVRGTNSLTGVIEADIWSDHWYYEFGEPIQVRVTLKNVSREIQVLGKENENKPVVDILLHSNAGDSWWSQEYPNDVKHLVTLKSGESYIVEWVVTPTAQNIYYFTAWWADPRGIRNGMGISVHYGVRPPGPMP